MRSDPYLTFQHEMSYGLIYPKEVAFSEGSKQQKERQVLSKSFLPFSSTLIEPFIMDSNRLLVQRNKKRTLEEQPVNFASSTGTPEGMA